MPVLSAPRLRLWLLRGSGIKTDANGAGLDAAGDGAASIGLQLIWGRGVLGDGGHNRDMIRGFRQGRPGMSLSSPRLPCGPHVGWLPRGAWGCRDGQRGRRTDFDGADWP